MVPQLLGLKLTLVGSLSGRVLFSPAGGARLCESRSQILESAHRIFAPAGPEKCSQAGRGSYIKSVSAQLALCLLPGMEDCLSKGDKLRF